MDVTQIGTARARVVGVVGLVCDAILIIAVVVSFVAKNTGSVSGGYWPVVPVLAGAALLIGVPSGALLGWSNKRRRLQLS